MSWQTYVDDHLVGSGTIAQAAIIAASGPPGRPWAVSPGYEISREEEAAIVAGFENLGLIQASGIRVNGEKFFTIQANPRSIYGKKQADGIVLVKTKQAILIAKYVAPSQAGEATPIVEKLADYLIGQGY